MRSNHQVERTGHQLRYWLHSSLHSSAAAHLDRWRLYTTARIQTHRLALLLPFPGSFLRSLD